MRILKNSKLIDFDGNLYNNDGLISFETGDKVEIEDNVAYIVPGFIDMHIHGAAGSDVMDNEISSIENMQKTLVKEGTTSFCPTTLTYDIDVLVEVMNKIKACQSNEIGSNIIGAHVEGPFINIEYKGAQNEKYIRRPNIKDFKYIDQAEIAKVITYAPEEDDNYDLTKYLSEHQIIASMGHSGASAHECNKAITYGANSFTHFHNASTGHHHRHPGVVSSGLMNKDVNVELIADTIHIHPDVLNLVYRVKGFENITLITDSMRAKYMKDGTYDLGGQLVIKKGDSARLEDGTLAGSILKMNDAVKNMVDNTDCSEEEAFKMASENQARLLKLDHKGKISENYDFDITLLDENFKVIATYVNGIKYN